MGRRWPSTRTCGGVFVVRCRSEPPISISFFRRSESEMGSCVCSFPVIGFPLMSVGRRGGGGPRPLVCGGRACASTLRGHTLVCGGAERDQELLGGRPE